jgi:beta-phosphoglucomutase-like phosphatase (HAD superfamily)
MQIKAILFDIDGTLIDSNDMHVLAWEEAFAGIGETSPDNVANSWTPTIPGRRRPEGGR